MKFLLDIAPLAAFFIAYKTYGLMLATFVLVVATAITILVLYLKNGKIAMNPLITAVIVGIFGGLTLYFNDPLFIKIKPTIINCLFALILFIGVKMQKHPLKLLMGMAIQMSDKGWRTLSIRWGLFFIFLAIVNEVIWRNYSEDFWVNFKVFGMMPLTLLFIMTQIPLMQREIAETHNEVEDN